MVGLTRRWMLLGFAILLLWPLALEAAVTVKATRVWPSPEYSRITVELDQGVSYNYFQLKDPERFVIDLDGVNPESLSDLSSKIKPDDPYVSNVRVALNRPGVSRLVVELKTEVRPRVFVLKPLGEYAYRLVMDMYPASVDAIGQQVETAIANAVKLSKPNMEDEGKDGGEESGNATMKRLITVAVDAGHGGEDPGAQGVHGTREKDVTLAIARRLKERIDNQENMRAVLIRDGDYFIPLQDRVAKARRAQADLFVSIHADSCKKCRAEGASVFVLSEHGATSAAAKWLARKENDADLIGGVNLDVKDVYLKKTLIELSQTAQISDSIKLGREVLDELGEVNALHKGRVEQAGFAVLKAPDIPSILVETGFINNPEEEEKLANDAYQQKLADAIVTAIGHYFEKNPPLARSKVAHSF
jgi:N-acetylmuramoyl-L-alanine amidase